MESFFLNYKCHLSGLVYSSGGLSCYKIILSEKGLLDHVRRGYVLSRSKPFLDRIIQGITSGQVVPTGSRPQDDTPGQGLSGSWTGVSSSTRHPLTRSGGLEAEDSLVAAVI